MPVTYADVWEFWLRHRELAGAVDFVTIHILPYWEDDPIAAHEAPPNHVDAIRKQVVAEFPGKEILIGEVGWPSAGRMRAGRAAVAGQPGARHPRRSRARQARELPRQRDRGVRPAVEARIWKARSAAIGACSTTRRARRSSPGARRCRTIRIGAGRRRAASSLRPWCSARRCDAALRAIARQSRRSAAGSRSR